MSLRLTTKATKSIPLEPDPLKIFSGQASRCAAYAPAMLGRLQDRTGSPNLRTRLLAGAVIVGLIVLTAPLAVLPVVHWLARFL
jgi:hypothetical protein